MVFACMLIDLLPEFTIKPRQIYTGKRYWFAIYARIGKNQIRQELT
jgi:hypothetical protein